MTFPLISVICTVRNRIHTIRRCVESVLAQDYPHFEFIVQDGASTDGTLQVLREYGDRIDLVSEPDEGAGDGMFRALNRCRGEIWGSCFSDEQLLPDALSWADSTFSSDHNLGAIYGYVQNVDHEGRPLSCTDPGEFDLERLLCYDLIPPFPASFFRMSCYRQIGLWEYTGGGEHELWFRLAVRFKIKYLHKLVAYYGQSPCCLSSQIEMHQKEREARLEALHRLLHEDPAGIPYAHLEKKAVSGYHVKYALLSAQGSHWDLARDHLARAISADPSLKAAALSFNSWNPSDVLAIVQTALRKSPGFLTDMQARQPPVSPQKNQEEMASLLVSHLREPTVDTCIACLPQLDSRSAKSLVLAWTHYSIHRPFNIWRALRLLGIRSVAIFGASGWGRAISRDLQELSIRVPIFIENNTAYRLAPDNEVPYCAMHDFPALCGDIDLIICSILGPHDALIMESLQCFKTEHPIPVVSWKTIAYLHSHFCRGERGLQKVFS